MTTKPTPSRARRPRTAAAPRRAGAGSAATTPRKRTPRGMPDEVFAELLESVREGGRILRGEQAPSRRFAVADDEPDAAAIRERMHLSQTRFALLLGISPRTLQGWEQKRRAPKGAERTLLRMAARHPETLLELARG